jgi:hypothetical protein
VLSPWEGFGIPRAWTALVLATAFYLLRRPDAEGPSARAGYRHGGLSAAGASVGS